MNESPLVRPISRVLLIDQFDRLLLFRGENSSSPGVRFWFPTGGGVEPGESPEEAARREVREETGLAKFTLGPHIWNRRHVFEFNGQYLDAREMWFIAHVEHFEIDTIGFTDVEREIVKEYRWWSQQELEDTTDFLTPRDLASLFRDLIANGPPHSPITVQV